VHPGGERRYGTRKRTRRFLLSLGHAGTAALAADTDGIDGSEDNAAFLLSGRRAQWRSESITHLANNDAYTAFGKLGDLLITGPTLTNVNDFGAILVDERFW